MAAPRAVFGFSIFNSTINSKRARDHHSHYLQHLYFTQNDHSATSTSLNILVSSPHHVHHWDCNFELQYVFTDTFHLSNISAATIPCQQLFSSASRLHLCYLHGICNLSSSTITISTYPLSTTVSKSLTLFSITGIYTVTSQISEQTSSQISISNINHHQKSFSVMQKTELLQRSPSLQHLQTLDHYNANTTLWDLHFQYHPLCWSQWILTASTFFFFR